jgi:hypothetical protein
MIFYTEGEMTMHDYLSSGSQQDTAKYKIIVSSFHFSLLHVLIKIWNVRHNINLFFQVHLHSYAL